MTYTLNIQFKDGGSNLSFPLTPFDVGSGSLDLGVPDAASDQMAAFAVTVSKLSFLLLSSNADVTLRTNSHSAPGDTIALKAGLPVIWFPGCGMTCPLSVDVASLHLDNSSGQAATVRVRKLDHP